MAIAFDSDRWAKVKDTYSRWWDGSLDRPVVSAVLYGRDPGRQKPEAPLLSQSTCADFSVSPEDIVDRLDYELSTRLYLGDAYPYINLDCFGPGVAAAFLGARLDNSTGRVWFHPTELRPIEELGFEYDPENPWLRRVKDICAAAVRRWQGQVAIGMPDLGGVLDILSTFRPSSLLPMDLYDHPEHVKRLIWELHALWFRFYEDIASILQPLNPGYTDWSGILSDKPSYVLQCDFAYMISPSMFDEFVRPELKEACGRLGRSIYHLDGPGQIPHLNSLLSIEELGGIQWIPGDGNGTYWPEIYRRIQGAGKRIQTINGLNHLDEVIGWLGTGKGIQAMTVYAPMGEEAALETRLSSYME